MKEAGIMCFCTAVNCMDGRVQLPVTSYLQERFNVEHVDSITEPGFRSASVELVSFVVRLIKETGISQQAERKG